MPSLLNSIRCMDCGHTLPPDPLPATCPACGSSWLDAGYDYARAAALWRQGLDERTSSMWRYDELLPLLDPAAIITMGEGWTPLTRAVGLAREVGHNQIFVKDERQSPTGSRRSPGALTISHHPWACARRWPRRQQGRRLRRLCARAGIRLWIFLTSTVPAEKLRGWRHGAEVVKITGTADQAKTVAMDCQRRSLYYDPGANSVMGREAFKIVAYEIAEQLARLLPSSAALARAGLYVQAVSGSARWRMEGLSRIGAHGPDRPRAQAGARAGRGLRADGDGLQRAGRRPTGGPAHAHHRAGDR